MSYLSPDYNDEFRLAWRRAEADPHSPINDDRLSIRARHILVNCGLWTRDDLRIALEMESGAVLRTARNCGPKTLAELRTYLATTNDRTASWDEGFGVAL